MKRNMNRLLVLTLAGTLALGTAGVFAHTMGNDSGRKDAVSSATNKAEKSSNINSEKGVKTKITENEARRIALDNSENGVVKESELKEKHNRAVYKIEVMEKGTEKEFKIDAYTGKILKIESKEEDEHLNPETADTKVSMKDAEETVLKTAPESVIKERELKKENGKLIFKIEAYENGSEKKYKIDAETGRILETETEKEDEGKTVSKADIKLTIEDAEKIALNQMPDGKVTDSELKIRHSKAYYEVETENGSSEKEFKIDANTGKILSSEEDD